MPKLSGNSEVSIFTCDRGDQLYSTFGHTALRIKDSENALDVVYNYGYFDFRTENFYLKFVKGDLQYFVKVTSYDDFVYEYQMDRRNVIEQTLNLPLAKKQELFEALNRSLQDDQKFYTYKFIDRNCTTMVMDKINALYGRKEIQKVDDRTISYRTLLYPYFENYFWYKLGINIVFGAKTDKDAEQLFLPIELLHSLDQATFNGKLLVTKTQTVVPGNSIQPKFSFFNSIYLICLILFVLLVINSEALFKTYLFMTGLLGLLLCLIGLYSQHEELLWNYNALLFNPLFLIVPFARGNFLKKLNTASLVLLLIYCIIMINKPHLLIMLPFILSNIYMLLKLSGRNPLKSLAFVKQNRS
ncbi:lipoprotein N-acyltransferase Lnb domain-containing protein [Flavobacterium sp.]